MENQTNSKQVIINYGLMLAAATVLLSLVQYAMGNHLEQDWVSGLLGIAAMIIVIVMAIKKYRTDNNGFISWGQAVKVGVGVAIIAGLIGAIYQYIFVSFIEPDFLTQLAEKQEQMMLDAGYSEEMIESQMEMSKKFSGIGMMSAMSIIGSAIIGFIVSAIAGAIMKKDENNDY